MTTPAPDFDAAFEAAIDASGFLDEHWLIFKDELGWGCDKCEWTGATISDFWKTHERRDHDIPF